MANQCKHHTQWLKAESISSKIRKQDKDAYSCRFYSAQFWNFLPQQSDKRKKGINGIQIGRSEVKSLSHVQLFVTPWTVAYQAPPMGFSRQEYWSGLSFPSPEDLPHPGIEPWSPALQTDTLPSEPPDWKGRSKTVTVCRRYTIHRKS